MKALLSVLVIVMFTQSVLANIVYNCLPVKPTSLFSEVILTALVGAGYSLIYYDDMTYLGYYSEKLNASLEFDYPINLEMARFYLGETLVYVNCK